MNGHGWWWQLFHDPSTPQFLAALGILLIIGGAALVVFSYVFLPALIHRVFGCRRCRGGCRR